MNALRRARRNGAALQRVLLAALGRTGLMVTISEDEPVDALQEATIEAGGVLVEVDAHEQPVAAYRKPGCLWARVAG